MKEPSFSPPPQIDMGLCCAGATDRDSLAAASSGATQCRRDARRDIILLNFNSTGSYRGYCPVTAVRPYLKKLLMCRDIVLAKALSTFESSAYYKIFNKIFFERFILIDCQRKK